MLITIIVAVQIFIVLATLQKSASTLLSGLCLNLSNKTDWLSSSISHLMTLSFMMNWIDTFLLVNFGMLCK
jgi:hypothetical protein